MMNIQKININKVLFKKKFKDDLNVLIK
jgi:hypothetical protein